MARMGLLRKVRLSDVEDARLAARLNCGYLLTLCDLMTPEGAEPFEFASIKKCAPAAAGRAAKGRARALHDGVTKKKFESQRERPTLGHELGPEGLQALVLPAELLKPINWGKDRPMKAKGRMNSTGAVADIIYKWVIATYGNAHVDVNFCERMEELLSELWPRLEPWGKGTDYPRPRRWSLILKNRFPNVRESKARLHTHALAHSPLAASPPHTPPAKADRVGPAPTHPLAVVSCSPATRSSRSPRWTLARRRRSC